MKSLSKGTDSEAIFRLIKVLIQTQQACYAEAIEDTEVIEDIAEKVEGDNAILDL